MNARTKLVTREPAALFVVSAEPAGDCGRSQTDKWTLLQNKLKRMLLISRSPIASLRWARAKHKALGKLNRNRVSDWQDGRSNSLADSERNGILMMGY
jgi:hypothetical protein